MAEPVPLLDVGPEPGLGLGLDEPGPELGGLGFEMGAAEGAGWGEAMGAAEVEGLDEADSTGGGTGALVAGGEEPVPIGGGVVVTGVPVAGPPEGRELVPGAAALEVGALGTADEGAPLGVGAVEVPFNPAPPSNLPAKHWVISGTSVSPVGVRERT